MELEFIYYKAGSKEYDFNDEDVEDGMRQWLRQQYDEEHPGAPHGVDYFTARALWVEEQLEIAKAEKQFSSVFEKFDHKAVLADPNLVFEQRPEDYEDGTMYTVGMTSNAGGGLHYIFLDYDGIKLDDVVHDAEVVREECLPASAVFAVYETYHGHHVIFPHRVSWELYERILKNSNCCKGFAGYSQDNKRAVLRVWGKHAGQDIHVVHQLAHHPLIQVHDELIQGPPEERAINHAHPTAWTGLGGENEGTPWLIGGLADAFAGGNVRIIRTTVPNNPTLPPRVENVTFTAQHAGTWRPTAVPGFTNHAGFQPLQRF